MKNNVIDMGKKWSMIGILALIVLYSLNCFALTPIRNILANDIIYADNLVITNLLALLSELVEVVAMSVFYASLLLLIYRFGDKRGSGMLIAFCAVTMYKYLGNIAVSWISDGSIPTSWGLDIVDAVFFTALEMLQLIILFALVKKVIIGFTERRDLKIRAAEKAGLETVAENDGIYPFSSVYSKSNCLLRSAFICAVITVVAKVLGNLVSDVWLMILYGFPQDPSTWLLMAVNYISKIIFGIAVYFLTVAGMNVLVEKTTK